MTRTLPSIPDWQNVDADVFAEIFAANKPAVLRGAVGHWPAVEAGRTSPEAMSNYLKRLDQGQPLEILVGPNAIGGRFFYQKDMQRLNFQRERSQIGAALGRILAQRDVAEPSAIFIQSAPIQQHLPAFLAENSFDLPGRSAMPMIWIGNAVTVATHYDLNYNIACVVAGRRRFTLFPPEQLPNLYVSPMENTPAGVPISMVSLDEPDFERYPLFHHALDAAQTAELGPGDAIYIPYAWWHHVRSLEPFNVLVNYWWNDAKFWIPAPYASIMHAVLALRDLPDDQRAVWRRMFDYYVFQTDGEALAHLDPDKRGSLAPLTPERAKGMTQMLLHALTGR
jgi:hypothetical protein